MKRFVIGLVSLVSLQVTAEAQLLNFVESPDEVTVFASPGEPYDVPFFGGFNNPIPQLVDIDGDVDPDLFVQEEQSHLQFYRNVGTPSQPAFELITREYEALDSGDWFRFADPDSDGDYDLFIGKPFNSIRYFQNVGDEQQASFALRTDTLRDASGAPVFAQPPNVPVIFDLDCDGELDLLLGKNEGTVTHYEQDGLENGVPVFNFVRDNFQNIQVVGSPGKTELHGSNALAAGDLDNDGIPDLLWGDFFELSLITFLNTGSSCAETDLDRSADTLVTLNSGPFLTRGYNIPDIADINGDFAADIISGVASNAVVDDERNLYRFDNDGSGNFSLVTDRLIYGIDIGSASVPAFSDVDGDGLLDLVLANSIGDSVTTADLVLFANTGNGYTLSDENVLDGSFGFAYHPAFGDLDSDGDDDLVLGLFDGSAIYFRNEGAAADTQFVVVSENVLGEDIGSNAAPLLVDLDDDGDLDLVVGESSGILNYFENTGTSVVPAFASVAGFFDGIDVGQNSAPARLVTSPDGPIDLVVGSEESGIYHLVNTGTRQEPEFAEPVEAGLPSPRKSKPVTADVVPGSPFDDLLVGTEGGGVLFFRNTTIGDAVDEQRKGNGVQLDVYPNPAGATVSVRYNIDEAAMLRVVDVLGREVMTGRLSGLGAGTSTINIQQLPPGLYLIIIQTDRGHTSAPLIVTR